MNSITYILKNRPLSYDEKVKIKQLGRPTPHLDIKATVKTKRRDYNRYFKRESTYDKFSWMCGCPDANRFYCFICLLGSDVKASPWTDVGFDDLAHLNERAWKHMNNVGHLNNFVDFSMIEQIGFHRQLDSEYVIKIKIHNEKVDKNRHILRKLIMCIKFCGRFDLALADQDDQIDTEDPGIFRGLIDFAAELDLTLNLNFKETTIFTGTSTIQNDLLNAMLKVCKNEISNEIKKTRFVAVEVDETNRQHQLVIIFRYILDGNLYERFWGFIHPEGSNAQNIYNAISEELLRLGISPKQLIAQTYDGASIMSDSTSGVQALIKQKYPQAYFVHSYSHQVDSILENAAYQHKKLKIFFADVESFATFFSESSKRREILGEIVEIVKKRRLDNAIPSGWNFKSRPISSIYENKEALLECLDKIMEDSTDGQTMARANGLLQKLNCDEFNFFLEAFYCIVPKIEEFLNQVKAKGADSAYITRCLDEFETQIHGIRNNTIDNLFDQRSEGNNENFKRRRFELPEYNAIILKEYCDFLVRLIKDRHQFTGHLEATSLFISDLYLHYRGIFPQEICDKVTGVYPFINGTKLKTELTVIYGRDDIRGNLMNSDDPLALFLLITKNHLEEGFSETLKLLEIICTTPMITNETQRCFSTYKRLKCFLGNKMNPDSTQDRLEALTMLSIEKKLVQHIPDFDTKVVEVFANMENRNVDFKYMK